MPDPVQERRSKLAELGAFGETPATPKKGLASLPDPIEEAKQFILKDQRAREFDRMRRAGQPQPGITAEGGMGTIGAGSDLILNSNTLEPGFNTPDRVIGATVSAPMVLAGKTVVGIGTNFYKAAERMKEISELPPGTNPNSIPLEAYAPMVESSIDFMGVGLGADMAVQGLRHGAKDGLVTLRSAGGSLGDDTVKNEIKNTLTRGSAYRVWEYAKANPEAKAGDIAEALGISHNTINETIRYIDSRLNASPTLKEYALNPPKVKAEPKPKAPTKVEKLTAELKQIDDTILNARGISDLKPYMRTERNAKQRELTAAIEEEAAARAGKKPNRKIQPEDTGIPKPEKIEGPAVGNQREVIDYDLRKLTDDTYDYTDHATPLGQVIKNPTKADLGKLQNVPVEQRQPGGLSRAPVRVIEDAEGNVYAWNGYGAIHHEIEQYLKTVTGGKFKSSREYYIQIGKDGKPYYYNEPDSNGYALEDYAKPYEPRRQNPVQQQQSNAGGGGGGSKEPPVDPLPDNWTQADLDKWTEQVKAHNEWSAARNKESGESVNRAVEQDRRNNLIMQHQIDQLKQMDNDPASAQMLAELKSINNYMADDLMGRRMKKQGDETMASVNPNRMSPEKAANFMQEAWAGKRDEASQKLAEASQLLKQATSKSPMDIKAVQALRQDVKALTEEVNRYQTAIDNLKQDAEAGLGLRGQAADDTVLTEAQRADVEAVLDQMYPDNSAIFKMNRYQNAGVTEQEIWDLIDTGMVAGPEGLNEARKILLRELEVDPSNAHSSALLQFIDDLIATVVRNMPQ